MWREPKDGDFLFPSFPGGIVLELEADSEAMFVGEIEVDESHFGGKRKRKNGRDDAGRFPVLSLLKRDGKVYTKIIPDTPSATLMPITEPLMLVIERGVDLDHLTVALSLQFGKGGMGQF
jgi:hypothetical protein